MQHVLSMRLARNPEHQEKNVSGRHPDPVRRIVQAMLVVYLSPVILTVLLIGAMAVASVQTVTTGRRVAVWLIGGNDKAGQPFA